MSSNNRDVWITGIGIVTSQGEGLDAHRTVLAGSPQPVLDSESLAPQSIHPMTELDLSAQIPKRGDQRQMEPWQRYGVYAAGMALDACGIKEDAALLESMDMIVAAGGGERDVAVDEAIMARMAEGATLDDPALLEELAGNLRPTLFLAQLPNLLAGNISIVHGVTGSSRTFMGEEASGADAARIAHARIAHGQSDICLIGGSYNAQRPDMHLVLSYADALMDGPYKPVWERTGHGGVVFGSMGVFMVLEAADTARARGATPIAALAGVEADRCLRLSNAARENAERQWAALSEGLADDAPLAVLSGATGAQPALQEERDFLEDVLAKRTNTAVRATGTLFGHGLEPQFLLNLALAAITVNEGTLYATQDTTGMEMPLEGAVRHAMVTGWGHWRGEAMARVDAVEA